MKFKKSILLATLGILSLGQAHAGTILDINKLNKTLQSQNAGWVAKDTSLNHLSKDELKNLFGLKEAPSPQVEFMAPPTHTWSALPATLDWRNKDGKNWVSPILNQGNCGSCVAFASIGVMETQMNITSLFANLNVRLSPQNLFACGGGGCESGWYPDAAVSQLVSQGVPDEACMPYTSGATGQDVSCQSSCADTAQRSYKASNYRTPTRGMTSVDSVKKALLNGPVITTLSVYADFMTYSSGVYKHVTGSYLGGHAVSIVGYDDSTQSYIIRNSWGESWGENGFAHVAYSDISGVGRSTWGLELPAMQGAVSVVTPRDYSYASGTFETKVVSSYNNTDSLSIAVFNKNNQSVWSANCKSAQCLGQIDTTQLPDGRYEVMAIANDGKGAKIDQSTRQFFYVVNKEPHLSLSYKGDGFDLNSPLKGRVEFVISANSDSVPMSSIEFHFKDSNGKETVRTAETVVDQMKMGWRTNLETNGKFEIWFVGRVKSNTLNKVIETAHATVQLSN